MFKVPARACGAAADEYALKAVFLVKFAQYVTWPPEAFPNADTPVYLGVLGDDPFGDDLAAAAAKASVGNRKVVIKRSKKVDDLKSCHILFVDKSEKAQVQQILASIGQSWTLTVGETDGFATRGGVISFYIADDNTVRFEINNDAAARRGLKIDPRLLRLAKIVH